MPPHKCDNEHTVIPSKFFGTLPSLMRLGKAPLLIRQVRNRKRASNVFFEHNGNLPVPPHLPKQSMRGPLACNRLGSHPTPPGTGHRSPASKTVTLIAAAHYGRRLPHHATCSVHGEYTIFQANVGAIGGCGFDFGPQM